MLSERKLEYVGKTLKELKMLFIEPGLKDAVEVKSPSGDQTQADIDTGKLVTQVPVPGLLCSRHLCLEMEKHKLETTEKRQEADWLSGRAGGAAQRALAPKGYGCFVQTE